MPVVNTRQVFVVLHTIHILGLILLVTQQRFHVSLSSFLFWSGLLLFFWLPGAYLEYPSDPWEHLRRIFAWDSLMLISESPTRYKFAYFWGWSFLGWVSPLHRRMAADFYSAFWQGLLAYQCYRFSLTLGFKKSWAYLQVFAFVVLFGTNLFSFRYYALSSTPLAYLSYFALLIWVMNWLDQKSPKWFHLPLLLALILFNHRQCLVFSLISVFALVLVYGLGKAPSIIRKRAYYASFAFVLFSWFCGFLLVRFSPNLFGPTGISALGTFKVWQPRFFETYGVHGVISLFLAIFFYRRLPRLSFLTLSPLFVLLFPPLVLLVSRSFQADASYRILYAMPTSFILVGVLEFFTRSLVLSLALIVLIALPYGFPWRGRLYFQSVIPKTARTMKSLDETADWFFRNRVLDPDCSIITDDATNYVVSTLLGRPPMRADRLVPIFYYKRLQSLDELVKASQHSPTCGILVTDPEKIPPTPPSRIANSSRHWGQGLGDLHFFMDKQFFELASGLTNAGWKVTPVPPNYIFYEPPERYPGAVWTMVNANDRNLLGEAHLIEFENGQLFLIDTGRDEKVVAPFLKDRQLLRATTVILTQTNKEHYGGLLALVRSGIQVERVYFNLPKKEECIQKRGCDYSDVMTLVRTLKAKNIPLLPLKTGSFLFQRGDVSLKILSAEQSPAIGLSVGNTRVLFMGESLAKIGIDIEADILKVTNLESPNSLLDRVRASVALISAPSLLWNSERASPVRNYFDSRNIPTFVSGRDGHTSVFLRSSGFKIRPALDEKREKAFLPRGHSK